MNSVHIGIRGLPDAKNCLNDNYRNPRVYEMKGLDELGFLPKSLRLAGGLRFHSVYMSGAFICFGNYWDNGPLTRELRLRKVFHLWSRRKKCVIPVTCQKIRVGRQFFLDFFIASISQCTLRNSQPYYVIQK